MNVNEATIAQLQAEIDRRMANDERARNPPCFFYGVWPGNGAGHYTHDEHGAHAWRQSDRFRSLALMCGRTFYPWDVSNGTASRRTVDRPQPEGRAWHWKHENWTVITMWDRSEDSRGNCCSTFFVEADVSPTRAMERAREVFPSVFARIEKHLGRAVALAGPAL